ncbi:MAG: cytochrome c [Cyclobacteriaceae bacterium]
MKQLFPFTVGTAIILTLLSFKESQSDLEASMKRGREIYTNNCLTCHMGSGEGIEGVYPPLAKSDYLMADKNRSIQQILEGSIGTMTVNGVKYNGFMTPFNLTDQEVSDVLNYVRNSWGNKGEPITPAEVKALR